MIHVTFLLKFLKIIWCSSFCVCRYYLCIYFIL